MANNVAQPFVPSINYLGGACVDPFGCIPIVLNEHTQMTIQYFHRYTVGGSHTAPLELLPIHLRRHRHRGLMQTTLLHSLFDQQRLYCVLALAAARMTRFSQVVLPPQFNTESFVHQALRRLRSRFMLAEHESEIEKFTICDMHWLAACEAYRGNVPGAQVHLQAVSKLVHLLDVKNEYDQLLMQSICVLDISLSTQTNSRPWIPWPWKSKVAELRTETSQQIEQLEQSMTQHTFSQISQHLHRNRRATSKVLPTEQTSSQIPLSSSAAFGE